MRFLFTLKLLASKSEGINLWIPLKKGNLLKAFLLNIFSEQPVSLQLSPSTNDLILFAIIEEIFFNKESFLSFLIPETSW